MSYLLFVNAIWRLTACTIRLSTQNPRGGSTITRDYIGIIFATLCVVCATLYLGTDANGCDYVDCHQTVSYQSSLFLGCNVIHSAVIRFRSLHVVPSGKCATDWDWSEPEVRAPACRLQRYYHHVIVHIFMTE